MKKNYAKSIEVCIANQEKCERKINSCYKRLIKIVKDKMVIKHRQ